MPSLAWRLSIGDYKRLGEKGLATRDVYVDYANTSLHRAPTVHRPLAAHRPLH